jgi:FKBP-type peptidyl-prolyl cis-trans isomerase
MKFFVSCIAISLIAVGGCAQKNKGKKELRSDIDSLSYAVGISIGNSFEQQDLSDLDYDLVAGALEDHRALEGKMSPETADSIVSAILMKRRNAANIIFLEESKAFMAENGKKDGVITTPSGLQYMVLSEGDGISPKETDQVTCHYKGTRIDGEVFDSSYDRGEPATFPLNRVIKGWTEGLQLMKEGSKYRFFVPQELGYGENPRAGGVIKPFDALIFDVELIKVTPGEGAVAPTPKPIPGMK